jgi:hypothetical protein
MVENDFGIIPRSRDAARGKKAACEADQRPTGEEEKDIGHVSAFPMMIGAAAQDRAAGGAGRGWWGGADDGSDGAGLEQHLHAGEVGEDCLAHSLFSQTVMMGVADGALGAGVLRATDGDASAFQGEGDVAALRLDRDHALVGGAGHAADAFQGSTCSSMAIWSSDNAVIVGCFHPVLRRMWIASGREGGRFPLTISEA